MSAEIFSLNQRRRKGVYDDVPGVPYLKLNTQSGVYYVRKYRAGKGELFKSTGETNKGRAKTKAEDMIAGWLGQRRTAARRVLVSEVIDQLERVLGEESIQKDEAGRPVRRRRTVDKDGTYLPLLKTLFGDAYIDELDEDFWEDWIRTTGRKLNRQLGDIAKYLSKLLTFAYRKKYINRKPPVRNPDPKKKDVPTYEIKNIREFLDHADPELRDLIVIGAECGLRPHENREMRWEFVSFARDGVRVNIPDWFEKRKRAREIVLSPGAAGVVRRRSKGRVGPFVFPAPTDPLKPLSDVQLSRLWRRMLGRVNAKRVENRKPPLEAGIKFHWLRHTFFTKALLEADKPLAMVAAYGGNSPKILFDRYMSKDSRKTKEMSRVVSLSGEEE